MLMNWIVEMRVPRSVIGLLFIIYGCCLTFGCVASRRSAITITKESYAVRGRVTNLDNEPIQDAIILLYRGAAAIGEDVGTAASNENGYFELLSSNQGKPISVGKYVIRVGKREFNINERLIEFEGGTLDIKIPFQLSKLQGPKVAPVVLPKDSIPSERLANPDLGPIHGN